VGCNRGGAAPCPGISPGNYSDSSIIGGALRGEESYTNPPITPRRLRYIFESRSASKKRNLLRLIARGDFDVRIRQAATSGL